MIVYLLAGAFAIGLLGGAGGMNWWNDAAIARAEKRQAEAQAQVDAAALEARQVAADRIIDMDAAFSAGMEKGRANAPRLAARTRSDVTRTAAFQTAPCVMPADSFSLYKATLSTLHKGDIADEMLAIPIAPTVIAPAAIVAPVPPPTAKPAAPVGATPQKRVITNPLVKK